MYILYIAYYMLYSMCYKIHKTRNGCFEAPSKGFGVPVGLIQGRFRVDMLLQGLVVHETFCWLP